MIFCATALVWRELVAQNLVRLEHVAQNLVRWEQKFWIFTNWSAPITTYCRQHSPTIHHHHHQPPTPSQQHTTTTQYKNNIKHVFEIANLWFLNFNCWSWRSWLLSDVILVELVLLNGIPVRLPPMMVSDLALYGASVWWEVWVSYRFWWALGEIDRGIVVQKFVVWLVLI